MRRAVSEETQKSVADVSAITEETLSVSGILLAKTFGQQDESVRRFRTRQRPAGGAAAHGSRSWGAGSSCSWARSSASCRRSSTGSRACSPSRATAGAPTIGDIVAFTTLQARLFFPLGQLLNVQVEIQGALALFDRVFEYLDLEPEITDAARCRRACSAEACAARLRFRHVSLRLPARGAARPSLGAAELA